MTKTVFQLPTPEALARRVQALVAHFEDVRVNRMAGIPVLNPALQVEAVGFQWAEAAQGGDVAVAEGVLITPWFMSLVRLPSRELPHGNCVARKFVRDFGSERFEFIGGHSDALGYFESSALFSPMEGFDSQALAVETAREVLALTRPPSATEPALPTPTKEAVPSRRAFFTLGRGASAGGGQ